MSSIISKPDEENDLPLKTDVYQSGVGAINQSETRIGGTTTASETFDRIGTAASEFNDAAPTITATAGNSSGDSVYDDAGDDSPLKWIVPLVILFLLIILGYTFCSHSPSSTESGAAAVINVNAA